MCRASCSHSTATASRSNTTSTAGGGHAHHHGGGGSSRVAPMPTSSPFKKGAKPAFDGASFDKDGCCVRHKSIQLAEQVKQDGRLLWKEIKMVRSA